MDIQRTATQARTETRTKAVAAVGLTLLAGLGAYGFGFLPGFENDKLQQERAVCYEVCLSNQNLCKEKAKDGALCEPSFQECNKACSVIGEQTQEQQTQQMTYEDVLKKQEMNQAPEQDPNQQWMNQQQQQQINNDKKPPQPDTSAGQSPNKPPQNMVPAVYPSDCAGQCDYDFAKCLTYQPRAICQPMQETCQMRCASTAPPVPEMSTTTLTIRPDAHPVERILIAGGDVWHNVAQYRASSAAEEITVNSIGVEGSTQGSSNAIRDVAIAQGGRVLGQTALPTGSISRARVDLSSSPLRVPAGGSSVFQVWVRLNEVRHHSMTGETASTTLIAPTIQMGLALNYTDYQYDVQAVAASPRVSVYTPWVRGDDTWARLFTVRNTRPYVTQRPLVSSLLLVSPSLDLYRFQIASDAAGPIALKKMTFNLRPMIAPGSQLRLSRFRFLRGTVELPSSQVRIVDQDGVDLLNPATTTLNMMGDRQIFVIFTNEQTVSSAGTVFTLQARVDGTLVEDDRLSVSFVREPRFHSMTNGYLSSEDIVMFTAGGNIRGPHLDLDNPPRDRSIAPAPFIWSDLLSPSHSPRPGMSGGSDDWILDHQLDDLDRVQILQAPAARR